MEHTPEPIGGSMAGARWTPPTIITIAKTIQRLHTTLSSELKSVYGANALVAELTQRAPMVP